MFMSMLGNIKITDTITYNESDKIHFYIKIFNFHLFLPTFYLNYEGHPENNEIVEYLVNHDSVLKLYKSMVQPYSHNRNKNERKSVTSCSVTSFRLTSYPGLRSR